MVYMKIIQRYKGKNLPDCLNTRYPAAMAAAVSAARSEPGLLVVSLYAGLLMVMSSARVH